MTLRLNERSPEWYTVVEAYFNSMVASRDGEKNVKKPLPYLNQFRLTVFDVNDWCKLLAAGQLNS